MGYFYVYYCFIPAFKDDSSSYVTVFCDEDSPVIDLSDALSYDNFTTTEFSTEPNGGGTIYSFGDVISFDYFDYEYQTLYLVDSTSSSSASVLKKVGSIIGIILLLMILLLVVWFLLFFYKRRKDDEAKELNDENESNLENTKKNKKSFKEEAKETIKDMKKSFLNVLLKIKNWFKKIFSKFKKNKNENK